jgi:hypothetical protein
MLISFEVKKHSGRLIVTLNNHEIINTEINKVNADPIKISKDLLASTNELKIEVSDVGIAFWATNEYLIENFKVSADFTDTSTTSSSLTFIIPNSESSNIEKANLRFVPECQADTVGPLDILINNRLIYSSVPDCGIPRPLEFAPANIITGENVLTFKADRGRYLINSIKITTNLMESPSYTNFFQINNDEYKDVVSGQKSVNMTFYFVDDQEDKEAEIRINGRRLYMPLNHKLEWSTKLNNYIEEGSNSIKVVPQKKLEIRKLEIQLEKN